MTEVDWKYVATTLYVELKRWGWGDFHYGPQDRQEVGVVAALRVYEDAARIDGTVCDG